jgi:hypothetical protein
MIGRVYSLVEAFLKLTILKPVANRWIPNLIK